MVLNTYIKFISSIVLLSVLCINISFAQTNTHSFSKPQVEKKEWFISYHIGVQWSGIKKEDFVYNNYTPQITINIGKVFTPELSLRLGYKGLYFNYIEDDFRHYYNFYYGEAVFNFSRQVGLEANKIGISTFIGAGYFYNYTYSHPIISSNMGIETKIRLSKNLKLVVDFSAIMGWDIYQGNEDILPSHSYGITYSF